MHSPRVIASRVLEAGLVVVGVAALWVQEPRGWLLGWSVLAAAYIGGWLVVLLRNRDADDPAEWLDAIPDSWTALALTMVTSTVGLVAVLSIVAGDADDDHAVPTDVLAVVVALLAWFLLHLGFAEQYARSYHRRRSDEPLSFPGTRRPNLLDFAYFSFTIGVSFAVSDVTARTRHIRAQILLHSVIGFFYNVAVIGIAVDVVKGTR
ncbi:putative membrane protein [Nocardia caishijiensis]|uniref:Membrane protein n=1 Tax=Nocardia caishijiensis TaxID=184756 RepID=A0ABQ6YHP6_9NOCA|nr:putative membrane protein [Nocardia caishijiensis]